MPGPGYDGAGPGWSSVQWDTAPDNSVQSRNKEVGAKMSVRGSCIFFSLQNSSFPKSKVLPEPQDTPLTPMGQTGSITGQGPILRPCAPLGAGHEAPNRSGVLARQQEGGSGQREVTLVWAAASAARDPGHGPSGIVSHRVNCPYS